MTVTGNGKTWPNGGLEGFAVTEHEDGTVTVTKSGSAVSPAFVTWFAGQSAHGEVGNLIRAWSEGRRGREGQYRATTRTSVTFDPATLRASKVWLGPHDGGTNPEGA